MDKKSDSYKLGFHDGYEEAKRQRYIDETTHWGSPFETIANKLMLLNGVETIAKEIRKCMSDIVAENWGYFGRLLDCYKNEYRRIIDWHINDDGKIKMTAITSDGYKNFTCDPRCFTDENFLKEKMNEKF